MRKRISLRKEIKKLVSEETLDWYRKSPQERFKESQKLWATFILLGGSYDPEPDTQSLFYFMQELEQKYSHKKYKR